MITSTRVGLRFELGSGVVGKGRLLVRAVVASVIACAAGCSGAAGPTGVPAAAPQASPRVALVAGQPLHASDVVAQMARTGLSARAALDQLVTFEILAQAAAAAAVEGDDGEARDAVRAAEVQRLIEREIEPRIAKDAISDAEVRALYERGKARFVHGRQVQVAVLCVFTGARMKEAARQRAEANARSLKAFVDGQPDRSAARFEAIARAPEWVERNVSFTTVWQGEDEPFPRVVGRAVAALKRPGDTTEVIGDETGFYIARYVGERPPENISFAEAAPGLRDEMFEPWRRQRFLQLAMEMAKGHQISVDPEAVNLLSTAP